MPMIKKYPWYDNLQFLFMLLMTVSIPLSWRVALWMAMALVAATLVKTVAQRKLGNPALTTPLRWALLMPVIYWLVLAVSLLWSSDLSAGLEVLRLKAVLLIVPLCVLLSDTSYLNSHHLRTMGYALLAGVVAAFVYFSVCALIETRDGSGFTHFKNCFFTPERAGVYHHSYIALYAVVAMVFVYHELTGHWKELKGWLRVVLIVALLMAVCYAVVVNSRAGMLAMGLAAVACVVHLLVTRGSWKLSLCVGLLAAVTIVAATQLMPGYVDRISATLKNVDGDARTSINRCNWHAYSDSPLVGYGVGDYRARQVEQYEADGYEPGAKAKYNAHNQYMESLLAAGIPGLLALLLFLLLPFCTAMGMRSSWRFFLALLTVVVMFNLLFESMLERQMGLLSIGCLYPVMVLILSMEENKFCRKQKS